MKTINTLITLIFITLLFSCSKDESKTVECDGSNLTYDSGIATIINTSCNSSGCHGANSSNGVFTSFAGLAGAIKNGSFNNRVINKQDMPKGSSLSQTQLNQIKCWIDNGYPEK